MSLVLAWTNLGYVFIVVSGPARQTLIIHTLDCKLVLQLIKTSLVLFLFRRAVTCYTNRDGKCQ